jgi:glycosyltransferase involved in cell wall biosynthesis
LKVLIITSQIHVGAAEGVAVELAVSLNNQGIHTDIVCVNSHIYDSFISSKKKLLSRGIPNIYGLDLNINPTIVELIMAINKLRKIILNNKYNIVETSLIGVGIITSLACFGTKVIQVVGLHQTFYRKHDSIRQRIFLLCCRIRKNIKFYAVTNFVKNTWHKYSGLPFHEIALIYNNILPQNSNLILSKNRNFFLSQFEIKQTSKIVICVARIAKYKGQDVILEALMPICDEKNLSILFVGDIDNHVRGTHEMLNDMRKKISSKNLDTRIKFVGFRSDILELMSISDVLVHAATKESFGLVLVEAMAAGLPIVSSNVEGIPEVLYGTDSIMFSAGDSGSLREAVVKVLNFTQVERDQVVKRGKERAKEFSLNKRTGSMIKLFETAICKRIHKAN